jgi:serine/threonine protein phosphatase PrpC
VITQALGGRKQFKEIRPNLDYELDLGEETLFLICSDGLNDMVSKESMEEILRATNAVLNLEEAADALLKAALDGGGRDNVSIVLGHYVPAEEHKPKPPSVWKKIFGVRQR